MAEGPGKYTDACNEARQSTGAETLIMMVFNGTHGNGFEVQTEQDDFNLTLPKVLRELADRIEKEHGHCDYSQRPPKKNNRLGGPWA